MSATHVDYPCLYCGKETSLYDHFVYERVPVQSLVTGEVYLTTLVHPCVYQYEEDNQLSRITDKDQAYARSIAELRATSATGRESKREDVSPPKKPRKKKGV